MHLFRWSLHCNVLISISFLNHARQPSQTLGRVMVYLVTNHNENRDMVMLLCELGLIGAKVSSKTTFYLKNTRSHLFSDIWHPQQHISKK